MQTFLQEAADYILEKHGFKNLSRLCIIIPTRRGALYFKKALVSSQKYKTDKPFLAPDVLAIDDFVNQVTGVKQIDQVSLLFELHDVFKEIDPNIQFERFMTWAPTLLNDFDKIDQYLVEAKALLSYMSEAKAIERWQLQLGESQQQYFRKTDRADRYFKLFENIGNVYENLKIRLTQKGLVYRGMAYRRLAENVDEYLIDKNLYQKYYILGFNALSTAEEQIFKGLTKNPERAETLWDSDDYYLKTKEQKAGDWLRKYKEEGTFGEWKWNGNELLTSEKKIQIIGVPNASVQAKVAGHLYGPGKSDDGLTAIVLGDENLLVPVMNSLENAVSDFNITMGLSLKSSMLFTLVDILFEMHRNLVEFKTEEGKTFKIPKFSHRHVVKVLNHPFIRRYELLNFAKTPVNSQKQENPIRKTLTTIIAWNKVFLSAEELQELGNNAELFRILFSSWNNSPKKAIKCLYELIDLLREVYSENQNAIETEYLYQFFLILQRLESIVEQRGDRITLKSFKTFLYELIKQTKIPFSGETDQSLQIMGMLETRTLDFDRLIILSVNEGVLPTGKKQNSLIPFEAFEEFGLPTHNHADAVMAYHFFRLLQRAKEVSLLHILPSDTYGAGEKSRFILQIEHELAKLNKNLNISHPNIVFHTDDNVLAETEDFVIQKTPEIISLIEKQISEKGIYPSHLNQFVECSLRYYFSKVAGIEQTDEISEKIEADSFGNWIHKTLENIDKELVDKDRFIEKGDILQVLDKLDDYLKAAFQETNRGLNAEEGSNFVMYQIGETILRKFLNYQVENESFPVELLDTERTISATFEATVSGRKLPVKIAGRIDRIDRINQHTIRVIDYKTGKVVPNDLKAIGGQTVSEALHEADKSKYRQLWLYKYMTLKRMLSEEGLKIKDIPLETITNQVAAGIYSFRNIDNGFMVQDVKFREDESVADFIGDSEREITAFVEELLDPGKPFLRTHDIKMCEYCDYRQICGR